ncbi:MAG: iron donor protein CyaY [Oligoflexia bacterium]|jgi:iron donor protein CyaY
MTPSFKNAQDWPEAEYRKEVARTLERVASAFEQVDPDHAECELAMGVLTIVLPGRSKVILSAQPAVRQLWLALASQGTAYHFGWDAHGQKWRDDKGRDIEVFSVLSKVLKDTAGLSLSFF